MLILVRGDPRELTPHCAEPEYYITERPFRFRSCKFYHRNLQDSSAQQQPTHCGHPIPILVLAESEPSAVHSFKPRRSHEYFNVSQPLF